MGLFADLKLKRDKQKNLRVTFMDKPLLVIYTSTVFEVIKKYATNAFLDKVAKLARRVDDVDLDMVKVEKMNAVYTASKQKFYGRRNLKPVKKGTRDYDIIIKASKLCDAYEISPLDFMDAHIAGLSFANEGVGVFPTLPMLINASAEQRILAYLKQDSDNNSTDFKPIEIKYFDRNTPLKENENWNHLYQKLKKGTASKREAIFVAEVYKARNDGRLHASISDYVEKFED